MEKKCSTCKIVKPLGDFYPIANGSKGVRPSCKECSTKKEREKYGSDAEFRWSKISKQAIKMQQDPEHKKHHRMMVRRWHLKNAYGLSLKDFDDLLQSQDGGCAICKTKEVYGETKTRMVVDHCHKTNKVRGILCDLCNTALGKFRDDTKLLEKAIAYLNT